MSFHGGFIGCVVAIVLFALRRGLPMLSLGDVSPAPWRRSGFSSAASPISSTANCGAGRPTCPGPWSFPTAARSRATRASSTKRPSKGSCCSSCSACWCAWARSSGRASITGAFSFVYGVARIVCEFFREPDAQLELPLAGGLTMGMLLCIPLMIAGLGLIGLALCADREPPWTTTMADEPHAARERNPPADRGRRADARRRLHAALPDAIRSHGYYTTRDPIGARGDFITAPEISQMFGELIGLWMAAVWQQMGAPENVRVVELGPGRGTHDGRRAARGQDRPGFPRRHRRCIWSRSARCCRRCSSRSAGNSRRAGLVAPTLDDVPGGPAIIVANEFFDALPVHQAVKHADGWHERMVEIGPSGELQLRPRARSAAAFRAATLPRELRNAPDGSIYEWRSDRVALELGRRVRARTARR